MSNDQKLSLPFFSHIYIEDAANAYTATNTILKELPKAIIIPIKSYKEVFNRPKQDFSQQKQSRKLILAKRHDSFYYEGSAACDPMGQSYFYYNTLVMNCVFDCSYCYLRGLYPSANIVLFVNNQDYIAQTKALLATLPELYLCLSYDSDILAFEKLYSYCREWIEFARLNPNLTVEIRTKSANFLALSDLKSTPNVIFAWTLSPSQIALERENRAPPLTARLKSAKLALSKGWRVRLCFDPIFSFPGWQEVYREFFATVFSELSVSHIHDISIGPFRMAKEALRNIRKQNDAAPYLFDEYTEFESFCSYPTTIRKQLEDDVSAMIQEYCKSEKVPFL